MSPVVDVVILTWNDGDLLAAAVDSALASTGVEVRVVVVDNGSSPPAEVVEDPRVRLVRNPANRGVAAGRNQGARLGSKELLCFLDSDARLRPTCLERLARTLTDEQRRAMAAPVFTGQPPRASAGLEPSVARKLARGFGLTSTYRPTPSAGRGRNWKIEFAIGACQLFRRSAFEEIGGFDERFFYGPEDIDACARLRRRSWSLVQVEDARCDHPPRRRNRRLLTRSGVQHALALGRYYWRSPRASWP